jgi:hypothetical protein
MMNNYNSFGNRSGTKLKTREPALLGTRTQNSRWRYWCSNLILLLTILLGIDTYAQTANTYKFTTVTGVYENTSASATALSAVRTDTYISPGQNIGFNFVYEGITYTQFKMSANGFISFGSGADSFTGNTLANANNTTGRPVIAPLWDDLDGGDVASSVAAYEVTGTAPNRVLTVEWRNWQWNYNAISGPVISFQVKLYETTNVIEFVYRPETVAVSSGSASIGISSASLTGSGSYLMLTSVDSPAVSSAVFTDNIATKPANGTIYRFTPATCFFPTGLMVANIGMNSADISWAAPALGAPSSYEYAVTTSPVAPNSGFVVSSTSVTGISGLLSGTSYYLHVRSLCGESDYSSWTSKQFYTLCESPLVANTLTYGPVTTTGTTVNFVAPSQTPFGYVIFRSASATPPVLTNGTVYSVSQTAVVSALTSGSNTYYCVYNGANPTGAASSLTSNTNYYYHVFSRNGVTTSECASGPLYSATALSGSQITAPATPGTVTAVPSFTTANLSWVASAVGGGASVISYVVEVYTSNAYTTHVGGSPYSAGSLSTVISGLDQGTTYYYRVKAVNGVDSSYVTGSFVTLTMGQIGSGVSTNVNLPLNTNFGYNYSQQIYTKAQFEAVINPGEKYINKIRFYYHGTSTTGGESNVSANFNTWKVYLGNTAKASFASTTDWVPLGSLQEVYSGIIPSTLTPGWVELVLPASFEWDQTSNLVVAVSEEVPSYGTSSYWRSFSSATNTGMYYRVDTAPTGFLPSAPPTGTRTNTLSQVQFDLSTVAMSCLMPSTLAVNNVTDTSATLIWSAPVTGTPTGYEYAVTMSAIPPLSGTPSSGTSVTDYGSLLPNTVYYLHARSACSGTEYSSWKTISFTTLCTAVATLSENFDTVTVGNFLPDCWVRFVNGSGSQSISTSTPLNGVRHLYLYSSGAANSSLAVLPNFNNVTTGTHRLRLKTRVSSGTGTLQVGYVTNISSAAASTASFVSLQLLTISNTTYVDLNAEYIVNFAGSIPAGARVAIFNPGTSVVGHYIDDVVWEEMPNCQVVDGLINASLTQNSSTFSWNAPTLGATPEDYEYAFTTSATPPTSGTLLTGGALIANATSLTADTAYYFHIRSVCGVNTYSEWVTRSFYTGYCVPTGTNTDYKISSVSTSGGVANISGTYASAAGYENYTSSGIVSGYAGLGFTISMVNNTSTHYHFVWVDWNNDFTFSGANEQVIATSSYSLSHTGTVTIPAGTAAGNYRMRIASSWSGAIQPCGTTSGEYKDYTITVLPTPTCFYPSAVAITPNSITPNGATFTWAAPLFGNTPEDYEYAFTTSATPPSSGVLSSGALTATSTTLLSSTAYYFHVRSKCVGNDESDWVTSAAFVTNQIPAILPYTEDFEGAVSWTIINGEQTNKWHVGTAVANGGTHSLYVSNDNGLTNSYTNTVTSVVYAYRDIVVDSGTSILSVSFDGRRDSESCCDYTRVWLVPTNYVFTGSQIVSGSGRIQLGGNSPVSATFTRQNFEGDATAFGGQTMRLVFEWRNDSSLGSNPPQAIDNIHVQKIVCFKPTALVTSATSPVSASLSWTGTSEGYEYAVTTTSAPPSGAGTPISGTSVTVNDLVSGATYYMHVRGVCDSGASVSGWITSAAVLMPVTVAVPWFEGFETNVLPTGWSQTSMQVGDFTGLGGNPGNAIAGNLYFDDYWYEGVLTLIATTPSIGVITSDQKFTFDYKLANYSTPYAPPGAGTGNIVVQVSTNFGGTYTTLATIPNNAVAGWQHVEYDLTSYVGQYVKFKVTSNYSSGDYNVAFDNFTVATTCNGTPVAGILTPAIQQLCPNYPALPFTLEGYQNAPGITLQWEKNSGTGWGTIAGATNNTYEPSYTGGVVQYRAKVTCATSNSFAYSEVSEINENAMPLPFSTTFDDSSELQGFNFLGSWYLGANRGAVGNTGSNLYINLTNTTEYNVGTGKHGLVAPSYAVVLDYQVTNDASPYTASTANAATIKVYVSNNCGSTYTMIDSFNNDGTSGYKRRTVSLADYVGQEIMVRIGVVRVGTTSIDVSIDNFAIITPPIQIATLSPNAVCGRGDVITVNGNYFNNITGVTINGMNVPFVTSSLQNLTFEVPTGLAAGNYPVVITNNLGSETSNSVISVRDYPEVSPIQSASIHVCAGKTLPLTSLTGGGTWSSSNNAIATVGENTGIVTGVSKGTVTIYYTVIDNGCSTTIDFAVNVDANVVITSSTAIQNAVNGNDAVFNVVAIGDDLSYQWYLTDGIDSYLLDADTTFVGETYSGTDTNTLTISNVSYDLSELEFYCEVTGTTACGSIESNHGILYVGNTGIAQDPVSVSLCNEGTAVFSIVRSGDDEEDEVAYTWQYAAPGTENWLTITGDVAGMSFAGINSNALTVSNIATSNNDYRFRAFLTGPINTATSTPAILTVKSTPAITTISNSEVCHTGGTSTFTATVTGDVTGYSWQYSADGVNWSNVSNTTPAGTTYGGTTTNTLSVVTTATTPVGQYFYKMIATGSGACSDVASNVATLNVTRPVITSAPTAQTVVGGLTAVFNVVATDGAATYQWQYATSLNGTYANVVNVTPASVTYIGGTTASLQVVTAGTIASASNLYYRVVVTVNGCSYTSPGAQLSINSYCAAGTTNPAGTTNVITNVVLRNTVTNANYTNNTATTAGSNGYFAFSNAPLEFTQGHSGTVAITFGSDSTQHSAVWIDFNGDLQFTADEVVALSTIAAAGSSTVTYNIAIPFSATPGVVRMRIRGAADSAYSAAGACTTALYGQTEDYWIQILEAPLCNDAMVAGVITSSGNSLCLSGSVVLTATGYSQGFQGLSLQWYNSLGAITGATSSTYTTPVLTSNESYYLRVSCSESGLHVDSAPLAVIVNNPLIATTTDATRCGLGTVSLSATSENTGVRWYSASTGGTMLGTGATFVTPDISTTTTYYAAAYQSSTTETVVRIGTGTGTSSSAGASPFYHGYGAQKAQYIIRASELTAAGVTPGYINSVRFEVTSLGTTVLNGFNIALGTTAQTTATANTAITGLTSVYTNEAQTLVSGMNTFTFNTPFMWDGVNNLVVEVVFSNNNTGGSSTTVRTHTAAFTGTLAIYADNATAGAMLAATSSSTSLGTARSNTTTTTRPDMYFNTLGSCESARVAVVATVTAPPALALSSTTEAICAGASTTINVVDGSEEYTSYVWTPSTGVSGSVGSGFVFNPLTTTTYELTATTAEGCVDSASVVITVNPLPSVVVTDPVQTMCSVGSAVALTASATNATAKVGNGTLVNTNTGLPAPISLYWGGTKHQMLILASELQALGFRAGDQINSIGFVVNNVGANFAGTLNSLSVAMGHTSLAALTATYVTGLTTVRTASNFTMPTTGYPNNVTIPLTSNFTWNGTGNLVVQTSFSNTITGTEAMAVNTQYSATSFNSTTYNRSDGATPASILAVTSGSTIANRPNVLLGRVDTNSYTWSPVEGLYTNAAGTIAYTGGAAATVYAKPSVSTVYTATATSSVGCDSTVTATVNVTPATVWYQDADNDGFGNEAVTMMACSKPVDYVAVGGDCNDAVASIYPGAPEVCYDGIVQNCGTDGKGGCLAITTTLHANSCGKLLTSVNSPAYSANPTLPAGTSITGYMFEITNLNSGAVRELERNINYFTMSMTDMFEYGTTYSVRVSLRINQEWQPYGSSCLVTTLNIPTTSVVSATCGTTLIGMASQINTTPVPSVNLYEFRVVNVSNPSEVQTVQLSNYMFNLTMLTQYPVQYATTYNISVRVRSVIDGAEVWSGYGSECSVTTPMSPTAQIQLSQCEMIATGWSQSIAANTVSAATEYKFILRNAASSYEQEVVRTGRIFTLSQFTGLQSGTTYDVTVSVKTYGHWSPEGKVCTITTPGVAPVGSREEVVYKVVDPTTDFSVVGYPNPFHTSFGIELRSSSTENLSLSIYDMTGRLLEVREVTVNQIPELQLGDRYPSGVYNVVASQGATLRTIRVVKR